MSSEVKAFSKNKNSYKNYKTTRSGIDRNIFFMYVHNFFMNFYCGNYSRAETNQGRKLLIIRRFWLRKLFNGGNYSRAETIRGNTVYKFWVLLACNPINHIFGLTIARWVEGIAFSSLVTFVFFNFKFNKKLITLFHYLSHRSLLFLGCSACIIFHQHYIFAILLQEIPCSQEFEPNSFLWLWSEILPNFLLCKKRSANDCYTWWKWATKEQITRKNCDANPN